MPLAYHPTVRLVRIVSIVAAAGLLASHAVASNARPAKLPKPTTDTSRNWAGYAVTSKTGHRTSFTSVAATWKQPKVQCDRDGSRAAVWVGIGGYGDGPGSLMQIGTNTDCRAGRPSYTTFYEVTPAYAVIVRGLEVRAGDVMRAEVVIDDQGTAHFQIDNRTTFRRFTVPVAVRSPDLSSAEWIAEAPTNCAGRCGSPPLANFGSVCVLPPDHGRGLTPGNDSRRRLERDRREPGAYEPSCVHHRLDRGRGAEGALGGRRLVRARLAAARSSLSGTADGYDAKRPSRRGTFPVMRPAGIEPATSCSGGTRSIP